jgi:hypothetical protein
MDQHDRELLDKQFGRITGRRQSGGLSILAIVVVFVAGMGLVAGMTLGGKFTPKQAPARTAMNDATSTMAFFLNGSPITR